MNRCLSDESLELLLRARLPWWRDYFWRRHLRSCPYCRGRWQTLQANEQLLADLRIAVTAPTPPSPLSTARSARRDRAG